VSARVPDRNVDLRTGLRRGMMIFGPAPLCAQYVLEAFPAPNPCGYPQ
jgi:hypothetical protein